MSGCAQTQHVLEVINLIHVFDFIATRDDVNKGKPDPEIYMCSAVELCIHPQDCLVIEDSPSGVKAALSTEMWCVAVATPFTKEALYQSNLLESRWIVDNPTMVFEVVRQKIKEQKLR